ncbi:hypothetical protein SDC9_202643 [bioreactor metagenome]|uniref:Uncharacterized protein n=1 Tax=bioreactor metagenome TaxID=1076179 RepID=A0A645J399_9ZZZZ
MQAATAEPGAEVGLSAKKAKEGFNTSVSPSSPISKTPISKVEPKRFFTVRNIR